MTDPALERRALTLFEAMLDVDESQREAWLLTKTGDDVELKQRITAIWRAEKQLNLKTGAYLDAIDPEPTPEKIGAYRISGIIGSGGMGTVFSADRDADDFDHSVAIKLIKSGVFTEQLVERFNRERQILARLSHPHIARLFDGGTTATGQPYIVMERVLVGTQALLGQGWDAPALNSLVLASNTASFMLSNQMRGRAIRIDPNAPDKVANIWHLATIEPESESFAEALATSLDWGMFNDPGAAGITDIGVVARRFRAFEGISNGSANLIESGFGRLDLDPGLNIARQNEITVAHASDRVEIANKWRQSLGDGEERSQVRETAAPNYAPRGLSWADTLQALTWTASASGNLAMADQLRGVASLEGLGLAAMAVTGVGVLASLPHLFKAIRLKWRNGSLESSLYEVAEAVLASLSTVGIVSAEELTDAWIDVRGSVDGRMDIVLAGVSRSTERVVMQAISEILGPVQNPRYLLVRKSLLGALTRTDYHAVPTVLGSRKENAEVFAKEWRKKVGSSQLTYTRDAAGRRVLLQARMRSFAAGFQRSVDRRSAWL